MSFKTYELAQASLKRYKKLCNIKIGDIINNQFIVTDIIEDECNFFIFKVGKSKLIYEKDVFFT